MVILHLSSVVLCLFVVVVVYVVILNVSLWSVCVSFRYFLVSLQSFFLIFLCVFLCHYLVIFFLFVNVWHLYFNYLYIQSGVVRGPGPVPSSLAQ